jgi:hypothetical protein
LSLRESAPAARRGLTNTRRLFDRASAGCTKKPLPSPR